MYAQNVQLPVNNPPIRNRHQHVNIAGKKSNEYSRIIGIIRKTRNQQ